MSDAQTTLRAEIRGSGQIWIFSTSTEIPRIILECTWAKISIQCRSRQMLLRTAVKFESELGVSNHEFLTALVRKYVTKTFEFWVSIFRLRWSCCCTRNHTEAAGVSRVVRGAAPMVRSTLLWFPMSSSGWNPRFTLNLDVSDFNSAIVANVVLIFLCEFLQISYY